MRTRKMETDLDKKDLQTYIMNLVKNISAVAVQPDNRRSTVTDNFLVQIMMDIGNLYELNLRHLLLALIHSDLNRSKIPRIVNSSTIMLEITLNVIISRN